MKAIYKYQLPFMEDSYINMPSDSQIIRVDGLDGALWVWAIVDTERPVVEKRFKLFKTGGEMPQDMNRYFYIGCGAIFIQMELMMYVFQETTEYPVKQVPPPFNWKTLQEEGEKHAI